MFLNQRIMIITLHFHVSKVRNQLSSTESLILFLVGIICVSGIVLLRGLEPFQAAMDSNGRWLGWLVYVCTD